MIAPDSINLGIDFTKVFISKSVYIDAVASCVHKHLSGM